MNFTLSEHAEIAIRERGIATEWIERAMTAPARVEAHPEDPTARHALLAIPEHGDRVLRVVYNHAKNPPHLITVYFDRSMKGQL